MSTPAGRAGFRGRQPPRNRIYDTAVPLGFFGNDSRELGPPGVADRPRQSAIAYHAHDVEVLDIDHLVVANKCQGLLMVIVPTSASNRPVRDGDLAPTFVPVFRSPFSP